MQFPNGEEERLDGMFAGYRQACGEVEPSVNFMPHLWERIEARRRFSILLRRLTSGFVTASVALSLGLVYFSVPARQAQLPAVTYIEALDANHAAESLDYFEPAHLDSGDAVTIDEL
jgi:hypothetical protein